jgi:molecular chaperone GrpE (heat shock protein)
LQPDSGPLEVGTDVAPPEAAWTVAAPAAPGLDADAYDASLSDAPQPISPEPGNSEPGNSEPGNSEPGNSEPGNSESELAGAEPAAAATDPVAEILGLARAIADATERYHRRAEQREAVIDHLSSEADRLRRGERRGTLRPLFTELCRLRNDLLRQATALPADFDAGRASLLLSSYAETVELMLETHGVITYAPSPGDAFDPRMHRRVGSEPAADSALVGCVASVRRSGYLDVEASGPIAPAEVVVFSRDTDGHQVPAATASTTADADERITP